MINPAKFQAEVIDFGPAKRKCPSVRDIVLFASLLFCFIPGTILAAEQIEQTEFQAKTDWDVDFSNGEAVVVRDPLEPVNRIFFQFNDKFYFWFLKPVSVVYGDAVPRDFRLSFRNCFNNLISPVSIANNFFQGSFADGSLEAFRFLINSTMGILGLADAARDVFGLPSPGREDLGQTLGYFGVENGFYLCWPILGPSTLRDTVGMAGDAFLRPSTYLLDGSSAGVSALFFTGKQVNNTSLRIGEYEDFLEATFDPYLAMRDAYLQQRSQQIKK